MKSILVVLGLFILSLGYAQDPHDAPTLSDSLEMFVDNVQETVEVERQVKNVMWIVNSEEFKMIVLGLPGHEQLIQQKMLSSVRIISETCNNNYSEWEFESMGQANTSGNPRIIMYAPISKTIRIRATKTSGQYRILIGALIAGIPNE